MPIHSHRSYLQKHAFAPAQIKSTPVSDLRISVVIPSCEEPDLIKTLESLEAANLDQGSAEILIVLNASENSCNSVRFFHNKQISEISKWLEIQDRRHQYHCLHFPDLPRKQAGVGLARKLGMDEAIARFEQLGTDGIIACTDADAIVDPNYLQVLCNQFEKNPKVEAVGIHFEHPLEGSDFPPSVYKGIIRYELFLRYYIEGLRFAAFPFAYHTIGSSMAVRASAYQKRGGMNRRKAGEDFYFLHKFIPHGGFVEIAQTRVVPSPRPGHRVPFGTGRAIEKWLASDQEMYPSYHWQTFEWLKSFIQIIPDLYTSDLPKLPKAVVAFLKSEDFQHQMREVRNNVSNQAAFVKRFFQWFDALKVLKYVHFVRAHYLKEVEIKVGVEDWYGANHGQKIAKSHRDWLLFLREKQKYPFQGMDLYSFSDRNLKKSSD